MSDGPRAGFEGEFRRVFEVEHASLFRYLARSTGDSALAADLAQEAFVRLFQRGALPDDARAWLVSVAHNLLRDDHRARIRRERLLEARADAVRPAEGARPDAGLEADERRARVRGALASLSERDRRALLLRHEGYAYREIARAVGCADASVGKLLLRATRAFRRALEEGTDDASG